MKVSGQGAQASRKTFLTDPAPAAPMRRATWACLVAALAGCLGAAPAPPAPASPPSGPPQAPWPNFSAPWAVDPGVAATEPEIAVLPDGTAVVCALRPRGPDASGSALLLWASRGDGAFERVDPPAPAMVDCSVATDAGGTAYVASAWAGSVTVATSRDGRAWSSIVVTARAGSWDRPWVAAGSEGVAVLTVYDSGITAYHTRDAGRTWGGPFVAQPPEQLAFEAFSNLVWLGGDAFGFAYGVLASVGAGLETRDIWWAATPDAGVSWRFVPIAEGLKGNAEHVFPGAASDAQARAYAVWAQERDDGSTEVMAAASPDGGATWGVGPPLNPEDTTALMPRAAASPRGPLVVFYLAEGRVRPNCQPALWRFTAAVPAGADWALLPLSEASHSGTVATGGYPAAANIALRDPGTCEATPNQRNLAHTVGAAVDASGTVWVAWTEDIERSEPRVLVSRAPAPVPG